MKHLFTAAFAATFLAIHAYTTTYAEDKTVLGGAQMSLTNRHANERINAVFADNILLTLEYMKGDVTSRNFSWSEVQKEDRYAFTLNPGEVFSYHEDVLPQYEGKVVQTTNAHYNAQEGFRSSGYLYGDGVCHLASLFYLAASNAKLHAVAPTNHDFAIIPEIDKKYGVSIYVAPNNKLGNAQQNLYVSNNFSRPVEFVITYNKEKVSVEILSSGPVLLASSW